ncbi:LytR/AlgR family response regulator transcription factor [Maribacter sp. IgM3_T14_3]|uniref:LytR/AlgR family response regulator transcription factor n=1 Tax=Maribacter sp. IgM3_T14_3 TaxID=3415140 RepID=UPI003C6EF79E
MYPNVVVLDDSPLQAMTTSRFVVAHCNLNLLATFTNIDKALAFISYNKVDILFTDVEMPGLNGFQVITKIPGNIKIIMNSTRPEFAIAALDSGANAFLLKPIEREAFEGAAKQVLGVTGPELWIVGKRTRSNAIRSQVC